jgi:hypothetical protein
MAKIKLSLGEQSALFHIVLYLTLFFFAVHLGTDALVQTGVTARQIGGDVALKAFEALMFVTVAVAQAGGKAIVRELEQDDSQKAQ